MGAEVASSLPTPTIITAENCDTFAVYKIVKALLPIVKTNIQGNNQENNIEEP